MRECSTSVEVTKRHDEKEQRRLEGQPETSEQDTHKEGKDTVCDISTHDRTKDPTWLEQVDRNHLKLPPSKVRK